MSTIISNIFRNKNKLHKKGGFTLIELLVTTGIFIIMTSLVLAHYGTFNNSTLLTNMAYDIALSIRQAQTYGVSVRTASATTDNYNAAYGVEFDMSHPYQFLMFTDQNSDGVYQSSSDLLANTYNIKQGASLSGICSGTDASHCTNSISLVDISFKRPNPGAILEYCNSPCTSMTALTDPYLQIVVSAGDNSNTRYVVVRKNGQISVGD